MLEHNETINKKPFLCRIIWKAVDLVFPNFELIGLDNIPDEPSIIVGNHSHTYGPIISEERLPFKHYTWCIGRMMNKSEVADYAFEDFWSKKPKIIRWLFWIVSRIIPVPASYILSHGNTIAVYRDSRCITTFRETMDKLNAGNHIVIYPEHYTRYNNIIWEFEENFIDVARLYYRKTGKNLSFVPMYIAPSLKKVFFGNPISYDPDNPIKKERTRIQHALMDSITEIAVSQPVHTVVPYPNVPKREYRKSLPYEVYINEKNV